MSTTECRCGAVCITSEVVHFAVCPWCLEEDPRAVERIPQWARGEFSRRDPSIIWERDGRRWGDDCDDMPVLATANGEIGGTPAAGGGARGFLRDIIARANLDDAPIPEPGEWDRRAYKSDPPIDVCVWPNGRVAIEISDGWALYDEDGDTIADGPETGDGARLPARRAIDEYRAGLAGLTEDGWDALGWTEPDERLSATSAHPLRRLGWVDADGRVAELGRAAWRRRGGR
jgi:hypothetical protein